MKGGPSAAYFTYFSIDGYIISDSTDNVNIDLNIDPATNDLIATITLPLREMAMNGILQGLSIGLVFVPMK